jgi:hypothetical protein
LTFTWAFVADVDIESERLHFLGAARLDLWAVWRIVSLRRYKAKLSYLPPPTTTLAALESQLPPLDQSIPPSSSSSPSSSSWVTLEDDFIVFWVSQVSHAAEETYQAPQAQLQDGVFTIFFIRYVLFMVFELWIFFDRAVCMDKLWSARISFNTVSYAQMFVSLHFARSLTQRRSLSPQFAQSLIINWNR